MSSPLDALSPRAATLAAAVVTSCLAVLGVVGIAVQDFAFQWEPVPAGVPGRGMFAVAAGVLQIVPFVLFIRGRDVRTALRALAAVFFAWMALHVPDVLAQPASVGAWLGVAESGSMALAGLIGAAGGAGRAGRAGFVAFGLALMVFGLAHFVYADFTASMIPAWMPQRVALAWFTGGAHFAAGVAVLLNFWRPTAAALEALMMACFVMLVHVPRVLAQPGSRMEWTMLLVATMLSGSALVVAQAAGRRR